MDTSKKVVKSDGCLLDNCVIENTRRTDEDFRKMLRAYVGGSLAGFRPLRKGR